MSNSSSGSDICCTLSVSKTKHCYFALIDERQTDAALLMTTRTVKRSSLPAATSKNILSINQVYDVLYSFIPRTEISAALRGHEDFTLSLSYTKETVQHAKSEAAPQLRLLCVCDDPFSRVYFQLSTEMYNECQKEKLK